VWIRKMEFMAFRPCPADRNAGKTCLQPLFATRSNGSTTLDCSLRICCCCALDDAQRGGRNGCQNNRPPFRA